MMYVMRSAQRLLDAVECNLFQSEGSWGGSYDDGPWKMEIPETSSF